MKINSFFQNSNRRCYEPTLNNSNVKIQTFIDSVCGLKCTIDIGRRSFLNKKVFQKFKRELIYSLHINPLKTLRNIIALSILVTVILSGTVFSLLHSNSSNIQVILNKDKEINNRDEIIAQKEKTIKDLRSVLPVYYGDVSPEKLKSMSSFNSENFIKLNEIIKVQNFKIIQEQHKLLKAKSNEEVRPLLKKYAISSIDDKLAIIKKVAPIPSKLPLAQATQESGMGKVKIAKETNNFFGIMEVKQPNRLQRFNNLDSAVARYFEVLNTSRAMEKFRNVRLKSFGKNLEGMADSLTGTYCQTPNHNYGAAVFSLMRKF